MKKVLRKYSLKLQFLKKDLEILYFDQITKRVNAIKFALKNKDKYCPWDVYSSSIELLFSQFQYYYESHREDFSEARLYQLREKLEQMRIRKVDKITIDSFKKQLEKDKKVFREINSIYIYVKESREKNYNQVDEITHKMFSQDKILSKGNCFGQVKTFDVHWKFDENHLADVTYSEVEKSNLSLYNFEEAVANKDTEIAKKILDLREYLVD